MNQHELVHTYCKDCSKNER